MPGQRRPPWARVVAGHGVLSGPGFKPIVCGSGAPSQNRSVLGLSGVTRSAVLVDWASRASTCLARCAA